MAWINSTPNIPPQIQERIACSISAAVKYQVPANIVLAIAEKEAGKPGQWIRNSNGTHDVRQMQFNTAYLKELRVYGITAVDVAASAVTLSTWRLGGLETISSMIRAIFGLDRQITIRGPTAIT